MRRSLAGSPKTTGKRGVRTITLNRGPNFEPLGLHLAVSPAATPHTGTRAVVTGVNSGGVAARRCTVQDVAAMRRGARIVTVAGVDLSKIEPAQLRTLLETPTVVLEVMHNNESDDPDPEVDSHTSSIRSRLTAWEHAVGPTLFEYEDDFDDGDVPLIRIGADAPDGHHHSTACSTTPHHITEIPHRTPARPLSARSQPPKDELGLDVSATAQSDSVCVDLMHQHS
jgi:hypothetical protein